MESFNPWTLLAFPLTGLGAGIVTFLIIYFDERPRLKKKPH